MPDLNPLNLEKLVLEFPLFRCDVLWAFAYFFLYLCLSEVDVHVVIYVRLIAGRFLFDQNPLFRRG